MLGVMPRGLEEGVEVEEGADRGVGYQVRVRTAQTCNSSVVV